MGDIWPITDEEEQVIERYIREKDKLTELRKTIKATKKALEAMTKKRDKMAARSAVLRHEVTLAQKRFHYRTIKVLKGGPVVPPVAANVEEPDPILRAEPNSDPDIDNAGDGGAETVLCPVDDSWGYPPCQCQVGARSAGSPGRQALAGPRRRWTRWQPPAPLDTVAAPGNTGNIHIGAVNGGIVRIVGGVVINPDADENVD